MFAFRCTVFVEALGSVCLRTVLPAAIFRELAKPPNQGTLRVRALYHANDYSSSSPRQILHNDTFTMGIPFDDAPDRPEHIDVILNGLDRYNPETTAVFQDY